MSIEKFLIQDVSENGDHSEGLTKKELLDILANELGYGVYGLHKQVGKKRELTVVCYSDGTAVVDIHKHQTAYTCTGMQYEVNASTNHSMDINVDVAEATLRETEF